MADEGTLKNSDATPPVIPSSGDGASKDDKPIIRSWEINVLGVLLIVFSVLTVYLLYALWPNVDNQKNWSVKSYIFCSNTCKIDCPPDNYCWCIELSAEQRVIVLVLLAGALGSFIHRKKMIEFMLNVGGSQFMEQTQDH